MGLGMNPILLSGALIFSSLLTLLSIGLTLTYLTTKVSNFAHGAGAAVGAYITLTVVEVWQENPYPYLVVAVLVGGALAPGTALLTSLFVQECS